MRIALLAALVLTVPRIAAAHYLWVGVTSENGTETANVYFQEAPLPGPGKYLDPFVENCRAWVRVAGKKDATPLELKETKGDGTRWLSAPLTVEGSRSIESVGTYGVYRYGNTDVLLHYKAKHLDVADTEELNVLGRATELDLDVVPTWKDGKLTVTVLWKGEPAKKRTVKIRGQKFHVNVQTDDAGVITFEPPNPGRYRFLTDVDFPREGEHEGKAYTLVRHHSSMSIELPVGK